MNVHVLPRVAIVLLACAMPVALAAQPTSRRPPTRARIDATKLFAEQCAVCHGKKGEGTPMGRALAAPLMNGETVEAITEMLETGVEGTPMPSFSKTLSAAQIQALAKYVAAMKR